MSLGLPLGGHISIHQTGVNAAQTQTAVSNPESYAAGTVPTTVGAFDYIRPDIAQRPDLFQRDTTPGRGVGHPREPRESQLLTTISVVLLSVFLFVTVVAWLEVPRAVVNSRLVSATIGPTVAASAIYAAIVTGVSFVSLLFVYVLWRATRR